MTRQHFPYPIHFIINSYFPIACITSSVHFGNVKRERERKLFNKISQVINFTLIWKMRTWVWMWMRHSFALILFASFAYTIIIISIFSTCHEAGNCGKFIRLNQLDSIIERNYCFFSSSFQHFCWLSSELKEEIFVGFFGKNHFKNDLFHCLAAQIFAISLLLRSDQRNAKPWLWLWLWIYYDNHSEYHE